MAHAAGWVAIGGLRLLLVHVGAALLAIPLGVRHVSTRPVTPRQTDWSRRTLLKAGGVLGGGGIAVVATERIVTAGGLPGAQRRQTGSHEAGTGNPEQMPVTQWIADAVPAIDPADYRLRLAVAGATTTFTLAQLRRPGDPVTATLDCTGGWFAEQEWAGTRLDRLVGDPGDARSVAVRSATGYTRRFPLRDLPHLLLATDVAGGPLSAGHGAPLRLVAPGRRGFWWVKWVTDVTVDDRPWWLQPPFPLQ
jgi:DMSO/TMAO reductase YedYZ molybdopterin-dependent catalytic subunit